MNTHRLNCHSTGRPAFFIQMDYNGSMTKPTWREEKKLHSQGYKHITGLDEAGRGAWAGPIVAAAVILPFNISIPALRDSKMLTPKRRESLLSLIIKKSVDWSVGIVDQTTIDDFGINFANELAMRKAVARLTVKPDYLLIDAFKLKHTEPSHSIIGGDKKVMSIAAASIIAKVVRDQILSTDHKKFPQYDFYIHKGYGTKHHLKMLKKHGVSDYHRKSYKPVKALIA